MAHPNEELVREGFAAFGRGDLDALRHQYFAEGLRYHVAGRRPIAGDYEGAAQVVEFFGRTAEVLQEMGVLDDDRRPSFEDWLERKLDGLAPGIRADTEAWLRTMRNGGPCRRPRAVSSAWNHMLCIRPVLLEWSSQYGHLREVTRDDVQAALGELHGSRRSNVLVALRSLFAFCKKQMTIFRSPVQASGSASAPGGSSSRCLKPRQCGLVTRRRGAPQPAQAFH